MTKVTKLRVENESGIHPRGDRVLVLLDEAQETSAGGIIIPKDARDRDEMNAIEGVMVAAGGNAFADWQDPPNVGERVVFGKFAGITLEGNDARRYRLLDQDSDVAAVRRPA